MLFLSRAIFDARSSMWRDYNDGDLPAEQFFQKLLELDPDDHIGLIGLGRLRREAGDLEAAEEYFWRAIRAHPGVSEPYLELGGTLPQDPGTNALSIALGELALRKRDPEELPLEKLDFGKAGLSGNLQKEFKKLPRAFQVDLIVAAMKEDRASEPEDVTERMRPLRLIQDLQDDGILDSETVDEFIGERDAIAPLLMGVLRDWAQDYLDEDSDSTMESALALLGETGSPADIPHLLEFANLEHEGAAGCAEWALGRIVARDPGGAVAMIESLSARLRSTERMALAEQILRNPTLDTDGRLLRQFSENLNEWDPAERDDFFPLILTMMAMARGREGIGMARGALMRQGGLLSRGARRECETLLSGLLEREPAQLAPPPFTIYEICAGEVPWEELAAEDEEEDEYDDEEENEADPFLLPPEPIRHESKRGRNDPCWCKSGKKYKKCHLESDERERQGRQERQVTSEAPVNENEFNDLRTQIGKLLYEAVPKREFVRAARGFAEGWDSETIEMLAADWQVHDWIVPSYGHTVLQHFLKQRGPRLSAREREMVEAWSRSYVGFYEVQKPKPGTGIELKDILSGETLFIHDVATSNKTARWDGLFARVVPGERGAEVTGAVEIVPRHNIEAIREWMEEDRAGTAWPEYLKANWPRIRRQSFEIAEKRLESLRLANTDGEELLFSKAVYNVADEEGVLAALRGCSELEAEENDLFVWLNGEKTVLGRISFKRDHLDLECNSRQRLERGKQLLVGATGDALHHLRDEFTTQKQLRAQAESSSRAPETGSIPKDIADAAVGRYLDEHYRKWPDMKLPALEGKTPREAARTARDRVLLDAVLKDIENGEDRKRQSGDVWYDVGKLRAELGM